MAQTYKFTERYMKNNRPLIAMNISELYKGYQTQV